MEWFIAFVAVAALGVAAMAAAGGMGQMRSEPVYDTFAQDLPDEPLTAEQIRRVRFGVTLRGYAMRQVDDLLDRLARELAERDQQIDQLTRLLTESRPADPAALDVVGSSAREDDGPDQARSAPHG